jgi:hypothetical protein
MANKPLSLLSSAGIAPADGSATQVIGTELLTIDQQTGKVPRTRLRDARAAHNLFLILLQADRKAAYNRALLMEMRDGASPVKDSILQRTGNSFCYNLNWLGADAKMTAALAAYDDLLESNGDLIVPHFKPGVIDPTDIQDVADVVSEEWSTTIREQSDFFNTWNRLANEFVGNGVGFTYYPDADTPWYETAGWDGALIPRRTRAKDEAISVFITRHEYRVGDLYDYIKDPAYAKNWDENEVKRAIIGASRFKRNIRRWYDHWPEVEQELKNNDLGFGFGDAELVYALHYYIKDFDGGYSFYVGLEDGTNQAYLYHDENRYKSAREAFTSFTLEIGNGTFHSIRGALWKMYPYIQAQNKFNNKMLTNTDIAMTLMLQGEEGDTYDDLQITLGPAVGYLPPTAKVIERTLPDVGTQALPMLDYLNRGLQNASAQFQAPQPAPDPRPSKGNPDTKYAIQSQQQVEGSLTANSVNRFYRSCDIVFGEQFRRAQKIGPTGGRLGKGKVRFPEVKEFFERCKERGVMPELITKGIRKVTAFRAIGNGSPQLRMLAFDEIEQMAGQLDETGRVLVTRDRIAARFNRQMADRYRPKVNRIAPDTSIAVIENAALKEDMFDALPDQAHAVHAGIHVPKFQKVVGQIVAYREQNPEADFSPMEPLLTWATNLHDHAMQHVVGMAADPLRIQDMKSFRAALEQGGNLLAGFARELQAQERHAQQSAPASNSAPGGAPGGGQMSEQDQISASNPKFQLEIQREQLKLKTDLETHQVNMQLASAKVSQVAQAMRIAQVKADAEIAQGIRERQTSVPQNAAI